MAAVQTSKAAKDVARLAQKLAAVGRPISGWGDGNCGYIIEQVIKALVTEGVYTDAHQHRQADGKK